MLNPNRRVNVISFLGWARLMHPLKYSTPLGRQGPPITVATLLLLPTTAPPAAADGPAAAARLPAWPPPPVPASHCAAGGRVGPAIPRRVAPLRLTPLRAAARRPAPRPHHLLLPPVPPPLPGMGRTLVTRLGGLVRAARSDCFFLSSSVLSPGERLRRRTGGQRQRRGVQCSGKITMRVAFRCFSFGFPINDSNLERCFVLI